MVNLKAVWSRVLKDTPVRYDSIHGPGHWARVERNGLYISEKIGADKLVVQLFALFHDCQRTNDLIDPGHGFRGAEYAVKFRGEFINIPSDAFDKLYYACRWHTDKVETSDITVAACWDADRLDISRVGYVIDAQYLNSEFAKEIVESRHLSCLDDIPLRKF